MVLLGEVACMPFIAFLHFRRMFVPMRSPETCSWTASIHSWLCNLYADCLHQLKVYLHSVAFRF